MAAVSSFIWMKRLDRPTACVQEKKAPSGDGEGDQEAPKTEEPEIVELQAETAFVFVIVSSCVLLFLFFFNSIWSAWLMVGLFCLGGLQVITWSIHRGLFHLCSDGLPLYISRSGLALPCVDTHCQVQYIDDPLTLKSQTHLNSWIILCHLNLMWMGRACKKCGDTKIKLPAVGNVTAVTLVVLPIALFIVIMWATHQTSPFAWVGQNLMVGRQRKEKKRTSC